MNEAAQRLKFFLSELYGPQTGEQAFNDLSALIESYRSSIPKNPAQPFSERDILLITYADQLQKKGETPLQTLHHFCSEYLHDMLNSIHLLPFYPYSSDDGFSVMDYRMVDPNVGDWQEIRHFGKDFHLMFDAVINHASAQGIWFKQFLTGSEPYNRYFITVEGNPDLSQVVRPRTLPLLTTFQTTSGPQQVWTTFSADQVDLNYQNPALLVEIIDILLFYISQGASLLRLDAIAYLWKEIGTPCIHLPQTHQVIQVLRAVLDDVAPFVALVTETNVPHKDNISYFGNGLREAQMVYNFALPPMVFHTLLHGNAGAFNHWLTELQPGGDQTTFFNFLASHDGIGLNPARGLLTEAEIQHLVDHTLARGGKVSYKNNSDGTQSPYELNINFFDALTSSDPNETLDIQIRRFMAAQAILLILPGVPGIYFHSLLGSRGWPEGVEFLGHNRAINRQKYRLKTFLDVLNNPNSLRSKVFSYYTSLLRIRRNSPAFHPQSSMVVLDYGNEVVAIQRSAKENRQRILCLINISNQTQFFSLNSLKASITNLEPLLLQAARLENDNLYLEPYGVFWATD